MNDELNNSTLNATNGKHTNSVWWKVFFWITAVLIALSSIGIPFVEGLTVFDYIDFTLSFIALIGLYGFCFFKIIGTVVFWRYFFYLSLIETVLFFLLPLVGIPRYGETAFDGWDVFEIGYASFILLALYRYAYKLPHIWQTA